MAYTSNMDSKEYWTERMIDRDAAAKKSEDELIKQLNKYNKEAFYEVRKELNDFYNKYAINGSLTLQEAQKKLTAIEADEYKAKMANLQELYKITNNNYVFLEMNELKARAYVTRQQALLDSINVELIKYSSNMQISMEDHLAGIYRREYAAALKGLNISPIPTINTNAIKEIINYPYAGTMFSDRIWRNKKQLLNWINDDLTKHLIKGSSVQKMSSELMDRGNVLKHQAERLVRTETNYAMTQGHLNGYKDAGIKQYEILAHLDARTSSICQGKNGQKINVDKSIVGTNCPPFHPYCRSTIIPIVDSEITDKVNAAATANTVKSDPAGSKELDPVLSGLKDLNLPSYTSRRKAAREILDALDLKEIPISIKGIKENGYCTLYINNGVQTIGQYVLNSKDGRNNNYKLKTAFHEAFHARGNGRLSDFKVNKTKWTSIEETFAECASHYAARSIGIDECISPAYSKYLIENLPKLKQLPEFKECNTIIDFGRIAWNNRINGGNAQWIDLYDKLETIDHYYIDYAVKNNYTTYMKENATDLLDTMLESMPAYKKYKSSMVDDLNSALKEIENGMPLYGNDKFIFENLLATAFSKIGVK